MEGINSLKILCLAFVCVCFVLSKFVSGLIFQIFENVWIDDLYTE